MNFSSFYFDYLFHGKSSKKYDEINLRKLYAALSFKIKCLDSLIRLLIDFERAYTEKRRQKVENEALLLVLKGVLSLVS